ARHRVGGDDGVTLWNEGNAGAELERARRRRGKRQRDEWIVGVEITLGQLAAAGIGRAPADRDMRVLAHKQRLEAALLERTRQFVDGDAVIGRKIEGANQHCPPISTRHARAAAGARCDPRPRRNVYTTGPSSMLCRRLGRELVFGGSMDNGVAAALRSRCAPSPHLGRGLGGGGYKTYGQILPPHPTPLPAEVGFIRLRPLQKCRTRVNPSSVGEGADRACSQLIIERHDSSVSEFSL